MENFNKKLRNIGLGLAATAVSVIGSPDKSNASTRDNVEAQIGLVDEANFSEKKETEEDKIDGKEISSFKDFKKIIKNFDYESEVGGLPIRIVEQIMDEGISNGSKYFISLASGQTKIGASMTATEQLKIRNYGSLVRKHIFFKESSDKTIKILILAEYK